MQLDHFDNSKFSKENTPKRISTSSSNITSPSIDPTTFESQTKLNFVLIPRKPSATTQIIEVYSDTAKLGNTFLRSTAATTNTSHNLTSPKKQVMQRNFNLDKRKQRLKNNLVLISKSKNNSHLPNKSTKKDMSADIGLNMLINELEEIENALVKFSIEHNVDLTFPSSYIDNGSIECHIAKILNIIIPAIMSIPLTKSKTSANKKQSNTSPNRNTSKTEHISQEQNYYSHQDQCKALMERNIELEHAYQSLSSNINNESLQIIDTHWRYEKLKEENKQLRATISKLNRSSKITPTQQENQRLDKLAKVLSLLPFIKQDIIQNQIDDSVYTKEIEFQDAINNYLMKIQKLNYDNQRIQNQLLTMASSNEQLRNVIMQLQINQSANTNQSTIQELEKLIAQNAALQNNIAQLKERNMELEKSLATIDTSVGERDRTISKLKSQLKELENTYSAKIKQYESIAQQQITEQTSLAKKNNDILKSIDNNMQLLAKLCFNSLKTLNEVNDDTIYPDLILQRDELEKHEALIRNILHINDPLTRVQANHKADKLIGTSLTLLQISDLEHKYDLISTENSNIALEFEKLRADNIDLSHKLKQINSSNNTEPYEHVLPFLVMQAVSLEKYIKQSSY